MSEVKKPKTPHVKKAKIELDDILKKIISFGFNYAFVIDEDGLMLSKGAGRIPKELVEEISISAKRVFQRLPDFINKKPKETVIDLYTDGKLIMRPLEEGGMTFTLVVKAPYKRTYRRFLSNIEKEIIVFIKGKPLKLI